MKAVRLMKAARHWLWIAPAVLGLVFAGGGAYMIREGRAAHDEIRDTLILEDVTTSADASIPNVRVDSAATAKSEAEVIVAHVNKITGGKTYSQLERDDPNRPTVLNSITLRTSLNMAVMGFNVSDLVVGLGLFMIVIGATHILFLAGGLLGGRGCEGARDAGGQDGHGNLRGDGIGISDTYLAMASRGLAHLALPPRNRC